MNPNDVHRTLCRAGTSPDGRQGKPALHWLPLYESSLVRGDVFATRMDCTHPSADPFFWGIVWDGLARHLIAKLPQQYAAPTL